MINDKDLLLSKTLEHFDKLSTINNINWGGCLYACWGVYRRLKKDGFNMDNVFIMQLSSSRRIRDIKSNKAYLKGVTYKPTSSNHFVLGVNKKYYGYKLVDVNGIQEAKDYLKLKIPSSYIEKFCKDALPDRSDWNDDFNRSYGVREINSRLGVKLNLFL